MKLIDCDPVFFTLTLKLLSSGALIVRLSEPLAPLVWPTTVRELL